MRLPNDLAYPVAARAHAIRPRKLAPLATHPTNDIIWRPAERLFRRPPATQIIYPIPMPPKPGSLS